MTHYIFDCDDVLLDWQTGFMEFCARHGIHLNPAGPQSWDLSEWIGCSDEAARSWVARFNGNASFGKLAAMPGARDVVWALRDAGHTISVLTACGLDYRTKALRGSNFVDEFRFGKEPRVWAMPFEKYSLLPLGASKFDALVRAATCYGENIVFIEDNFQHAQAGVLSGIKSYCLRRSHNRRCEIENPTSDVIWIDDLREILS